MSVRIRTWKKGKQMGFEVDIRTEYPDGSKLRRRLKAPVESKSAAKRWGEAKERELLRMPSPRMLLLQQPKEVPTLVEFGPRYIDNHALADRLKASTVDWLERIFKNHVYPALGHKRLDQITNEDIQSLKATLVKRSRKTVNNVLGVLAHALKLAVEWGVIDAMPCRIKLLRVKPGLPRFYDFDEYRRIVEAAHDVDPRAELVVRLGGDAGLRRGEMLALKWGDIDFKRRQLQVCEAVWERKRADGTGYDRVVDTPKGGGPRVVPLTDALYELLRAQRHLRGEHVLFGNDGRPATSFFLRDLLEAAQKRAGLRATGGTHILRHTFCSHLAMRGAPARAIQELAGHADLTTTMRYMHLSPATRQQAIRLLDRRDAGHFFGEIGETPISGSPTTGNA